MCRVKRVGGNTFFYRENTLAICPVAGFPFFAQGSENQLVFVSAWISSCVIFFFHVFLFETLSCSPAHRHELARQ